MTKEIFLFDTYALLEVINKNPYYDCYLEMDVIINEFIFAEFCYKLIRENVSDYAKLIQEVIPAIVKVDADIILAAMEFRVLHKKKNLSMTDCISYLMSKKMEIKFLTGDKEFEDMENVEFVK